MLIAYIIIETEPRIGQFLQAALLLPAGKRPKKAKKPDCMPIWWLSGHITAKKSQIWLDISQISSTFEQLQLARAATAALCAPSKRHNCGTKGEADFGIAPHFLGFLDPKSHVIWASQRGCDFIEAIYKREGADFDIAPI